MVSNEDGGDEMMLESSKGNQLETDGADLGRDMVASCWMVNAM
jgi:hypothetical protein